MNRQATSRQGAAVMQPRRNRTLPVFIIAATCMMSFVVPGCLERTDQGQGATPSKQPPVNQQVEPVEPVKTSQPPQAPDLPQVPDPPATTEKPATVEPSKPAPAEQAYEIRLRAAGVNLFSIYFDRYRFPVKAGL